MLPALGRSSRPTMCSRVDLPEPDGPTSATISPRRMTKLASWMTSSRLPPWAKVRVMPDAARTTLSTSLIAQRLDGIEPRGPPGGVERRQEGKAERHRDHQDHVLWLNDRRQRG